MVSDLNEQPRSCFGIISQGSIETLCLTHFLLTCTILENMVRPLEIGSWTTSKTKVGKVRIERREDGYKGTWSQPDGGFVIVTGAKSSDSARRTVVNTVTKRLSNSS